jgi:hypothetical protein
MERDGRFGELVITANNSIKGTDDSVNAAVTALESV